MKATPEDVAKPRAASVTLSSLNAASMKATPEDVAKPDDSGSGSTSHFRLNEGHARRRGEGRARRRRWRHLGASMKATPEDVAKTGHKLARVVTGIGASMKATPEDVAKPWRLTCSVDTPAQPQ